MVTGPLRGFLWVLGPLGVVWLLLGLTMVPAMTGMMDGRMMRDGMMGGGMMDGGTEADGMPAMPGMAPMMGLMVVQLAAMLGPRGSSATRSWTRSGAGDAPEPPVSDAGESARQRAAGRRRGAP